MEGATDTRDLTFWEHVGVLRNHIFIGVGVFVCLVVIFFSYTEDIFIHYLLKPLHGEELLFLSPLGPFLFRIQVSIYAGIIAAFPLWLGLVAHFISPVLSSSKRSVLSIFVLLSMVLGGASLLVTYFYFLPITLSVLQSFEVPGIRTMLTAESYLSFAILELIVVFLVLQIPIIITALSYVRILNPNVLVQHRRLAIVGIVTALAVVTPTTDAVTLCIVALPAIVLWEIAVAISRLVYNKRA